MYKGKAHIAPIQNEKITSPGTTGKARGYTHPSQSSFSFGGDATEDASKCLDESSGLIVIHIICPSSGACPRLPYSSFIQTCCRSSASSRRLHRRPGRTRRHIGADRATPTRSRQQLQPQQHESPREEKSNQSTAVKEERIGAIAGTNLISQ